MKRNFYLCLWLCVVLAMPALGYRKAVETRDNVKNKKYPRNKKIEFNINAGSIINQSYTDTFTINGNINYFLSEAWGISLDVVFNMEVFN